jgi:hypothetical protein
LQKVLPGAKERYYSEGDKERYERIAIFDFAPRDFERAAVSIRHVGFVFPPVVQKVASFSA